MENNALRVDMGEVEYKVYMVSAYNKAIDMDKISRHAFSHNFVITAERWTEIKKYFSLLDKAAKLYFTTSDEKVLVTGTDKNKSLQDSLCVPLGVRGNFNEYIIINVFDILSVEKGDITFDFSANLCKISTGTKTYIVSCLHK